MAGHEHGCSAELAAQFDLERLTPDFYADPYPTYRALREHAPVKRMPDGAFFLTRYDDLVAVYKRPKLFSSDKNGSSRPSTAPRRSSSTTRRASSSTTRRCIRACAG